MERIQPWTDFKHKDKPGLKHYDIFGAWIEINLGQITTTRTNLSQDNTEEEGSKQEEGKSASNTNSGSSGDQPRVTEGKFRSRE